MGCSLMAVHPQQLPPLPSEGGGGAQGRGHVLPQLHFPRKGVSPAAPSFSWVSGIFCHAIFPPISIGGKLVSHSEKLSPTSTFPNPSPQVLIFACPQNSSFLFANEFPWRSSHLRALKLPARQQTAAPSLHSSGKRPL